MKHLVLVLVFIICLVACASANEGAPSPNVIYRLTQYGEYCKDLGDITCSDVFRRHFAYSYRFKNGRYIFKVANPIAVDGQIVTERELYGGRIEVERLETLPPHNVKE